MLARAPDVPEVLELALVELAEQLVEQHLREPDDRVERGAQLVRHAGEELRLVAADHLQLGRPLLEVAEQPRVEDGERGLAGERLQQLAGLLRELARRATAAPRGRRRSGPRGASAPPPSTASRCRTAPVDGRPGPGRARSAICSGRPSSAARPTNVSCSEISTLRSRSSVSSLVPYAVRTKKCCSASSNSINEPPSVPDIWTACMTIVDSTVPRSRLELTASPSLPSASSWSTLWASSALRASSARTRSRLRTAIAAAAANAVSSVMARSSNGSTSVRHTNSTPMTSSSSIIGAPMVERKPSIRWASCRPKSGSASTSLIWSARRSRPRRPWSDWPSRRYG